MRAIVPGLRQIPLGSVNASLGPREGGLTLIDTRVPGREEKILAAVEELRRTPQEIQSIVVTLHADHHPSFGALPGEVGGLIGSLLR